MTDETSPVEEPTTDVEETSEPTDEQPDIDWKAEARKWESRAKKNKDAADRLAEYEESQKTETQKLADRLEAAESDSKTTKAELMRLRVAMKKGLTEAQAKRLLGDSEEELEQDADELLASFASEAEERDVRRRPQERLRPGASPDAEPAPDSSAIAEQVRKRIRGGI